MSSPKILVVDDSRFMRNIVCSTLQSAGFDVVDAEDGEKALAAVAEHQPDSILTDMLMPNMDGLEFLRHLRAGEYAETPVIVLSADIQESTKSECDRMNVFRFLNKPCEESEIISSVNESLQKATTA